MTRDREKEYIREFENLVSYLQDGLFRYAFWRTGSVADAEDIVQDVLVRFYNNGYRAGTVTDPKSYLYRAVANASVDYVRKGTDITLEAVGNHARVPEEETENYEEDYLYVSGLMKELPPEQAEVIRLRTMAGLTFVEIANLEDLPVTTVKSRYKYGIEKLRAAFKGKK